MNQLAIGLDLRKHSYRAALVDRWGNVHLRISETIPGKVSQKSYYGMLTEGIFRLTKDLPEDHVVRGVGISAPNGNYFTGEIIDSPNLPFEGAMNIVNLLKQKMGYKLVVLTNDADAVALGELLYGGARQMKDFIEIIIRFGLGAGIIVNRHVMQGRSGIAGEIGHTKVYGAKRKCGCGKTGCLETLVSELGIMRNLIELSGGNADELSVIETDNKQDADISETLELVHLKNPKAIEAFRISGKFLGYALANLYNLFDPEAFFIQGKALQAGEAFTNPLKEEFSKTASFKTKPFEDMVKVSSLPIETANMLGASAIIWKELGY